MATERAHRIRGNRTDEGARLRNLWVKATPSQCEPLTFGDLRRGEKFIYMPMPGDNDGHDGLLGGAWIFEKIGPVTLCGNAIRLFDGIVFDFSDDMWVCEIR